MKRSISAVLLLFLLLSFNQYASAQSPAFPQKFHLEKNSALDESNKPFVFKGISTRDPVGMFAGNASFQNECVPLDDKIFREIKAWGANTVRFPVLPFFWKIQGKNSTLKSLDRAVELAGKHQLYVVIAYQATGWPGTDNPSDKSGRSTVEEFHSFWNDVSNHFKGNKVVAMYELFSEPVTKEFTKISDKDWIDWTSNMGTVVEIIRKNDPSAICLVSGLSWARDISFVGSNPMSNKNIGYSVHPYPYESQLTTMKNLKTATAVAKKHFVFATEVGYDIELFVSLSDVQKRILELYPEVKQQMDEVKRLSGNKLYYSDMTRRLLNTLMANPKTSAYLKDVTDNYQGELKRSIEEGNISWCAWCMSCAWRPCLLSDKEFSPTESGEFFKGLMSGEK